MTGKYHVCDLHVESDADDLKDYIRTVGSFVLESDTPLIGMMSDFKDDPRELHEIPEAIALAQRVIETGLLSLFKVNYFDEPDYMPLGLGAMQLYAIANNLVIEQKAEIDIMAFWECLMLANKRCDAVIAGEETTFPLVEGQSRIRGFDRFWERN